MKIQESQDQKNKEQRDDTSQKSQIVRNFEELRQSIQNFNELKDHRRKSIQNINAERRQSAADIQRRQSDICQSQTLNGQATTVNLQHQENNDNKTKTEKQNEIMKMDEHKIDLEELYLRFKTNPVKGMSNARAVQLNQELGDNKLTERGKEPLWKKYIKEITTPFAILLWIAAIFCFVTYYLSPEDPSNLYLGFVLIAVIFVTAQITYQQNKKSEALMESFKNFLPQKSTVIRDGQQQVIHSEKLVVGDIVQVKAGERIPADIRIIQSNEMKVDNSPLTGESEPQLRTPICTHPDSPLETQNVAFFGTLCKEGFAVGVVIKIGDLTTLGLIADLASQEKQQLTPLRIELNRLIIVMVIIALSLGILFFLLSYLLLGYDLITCVLFGIGILVANVPEGLLGCITVSLAITAKALHSKNVLVKNLEAVETLGSTSCICSDKTGTLTQNVMTVEHMWYGLNTIKAVNKSTIGDHTKLEYDENHNDFKELHQSAMISSEARFDRSKQQDLNNINYLKCDVIGDATETGLVRFFQYIEDVEETRKKYKVPQNKDKTEAKMPFNSNVKFALTIIEYPTQNSDYCIYIKGAPEKIWTFCSFIQNNGQPQKIDSATQKIFNDVNLKFGRNGERVLGFAKLHLPKSDFPLHNTDFVVSNPNNFNFEMKNFTFTGLISLIDPPKTRVPYAILECRSAGIKVIMVTGDQPPTAATIARQVNIIPEYVKTTEEIMLDQECTWEEAVEQAEAIVVHGDRIVASLDREIEEGLPQYSILRKWVKKPYCVFARTTPAQKLQIVQACQKEGFITAVTGDGVNDSPAIKQGDIGISMNITGSDVTKDAADMVLLDDDFASIVSGVEEGRKIFDNLKKTFVYLLCSNIPEILPFLAAIIWNLPLPLTNIYMLSICVGTDLYPAIALAYEEAEIDIMTRKPRSKDDHIVSLVLMTHSYALMGIISMAAGFTAYFTSLNYYGFPIMELFGMGGYSGYYPIKHDFGDYSNKPLGAMYNINIMYNNSTNQDITNCNDAKTLLADNSWTPDWFKVGDGEYDLRKAFVKCNTETGNWESLVSKWSDCDVNSDHTHSSFVNNTACYSTDGLKYAQSCFFVCIVLFQWSNIFACKSRKSSFATSPFNRQMIQGIAFETILAIFLVLTPGVNQVFGGRPIDFFLFMIPAAPFSILVLAWDETRKYLVRINNWFLKYCYW
ncbi:hypothetical protein ABPG72_016096 [Tetrahymena utriculariae]